MSRPIIQNLLAEYDDLLKFSHSAINSSLSDKGTVDQQMALAEQRLSQLAAPSVFSASMAEIEDIIQHEKEKLFRLKRDLDFAAPDRKDIYQRQVDASQAKLFRNLETRRELRRVSNEMKANLETDQQAMLGDAEEKLMQQRSTSGGTSFTIKKDGKVVGHTTDPQSADYAEKIGGFEVEVDGTGGKQTPGLLGSPLGEASSPGLDLGGHPGGNEAPVYIDPGPGNAINPGNDIGPIVAPQPQPQPQQQLPDLTVDDVLDEFARDPNADFGEFWNILIQNFGMEPNEAEWELKYARDQFLASVGVGSGGTGVTPAGKNQISGGGGTLPGTGVDPGGHPGGNEDPVYIDPGTGGGDFPGGGGGNADAAPPPLDGIIPGSGLGVNRPPTLEDLYWQQGTGMDALYGNFINKNFGTAGAYSDFFSSPTMDANLQTAGLMQTILDPASMNGGIANFLNNGGFNPTPTSLAIVPGADHLNKIADFISGNIEGPIPPGSPAALQAMAINDLMSAGNQATQFAMAAMPYLNSIPSRFRSTMAKSLQNAFNSIIAQHGLDTPDDGSPGSFQMLPYLQNQNFNIPLYS